MSEASESLGARMCRLASEHAVLLGIIAVGAIVRLATLNQNLWLDESLAYQVVTLDPHEMLGRILDAETNPPLYFIFLAPWERIFGDGDLALRTLSALFGIATIPVVYAAGVTLANRRAGVIAAALTAASPYMVWYSQEVRPYPLVALLAAASFLCFAHVLRGGSRRWLWGWALASALAISTHYFAAVPFAIEAGWLLWTMRGQRVDVLLASAGVGVVGLVLLPLAVAQRGLASWIQYLDVGERVAQIPQHLIVGMDAPWGFVGPLGVAIVAVAVVYAITRVDRDSLDAAWIAGGVLVIGIAIVLVGVAAGSDLLNTRNLIPLWTPFAVMLGALFGASAMRRIGPPLVAGLCVIGVGLAVWTAYTTATARPDWQAVADAIGPTSDGRVVLTRSGFTTPLYIYVDGGGRDADPNEQPTTSEIDVLTLRPMTDYSIGPCWWLGTCGGHELLGAEELPYPIPRQFEHVGQVTTPEFTIDRYRSSEPVTLPPTPFAAVLVQNPS